MRHVAACVAALALATGWMACSGDGSSLPEYDANITFDTQTGTPCTGPQDCDDGDGCTVDTCVAGKCANKPRDCDDANPCTQDSCVDGKCKVTKIEACCISDNDCDDKDFCTPNDACVNNACQYQDRLPPPCCTAQDQCDDENECTFDDCNNHKCTHTPVKGENCCLGDSDCLDANVCTKDTCVAGKCVHENLGCCESDSDCVTTQACQVGTCVKTGSSSGKCSFAKDPDCCQKDADCDPPACFSAVCQAPKCIKTPLPNCCTQDSECGGDPCIQCVILPAEARGACHVRTTPECCVSQIFAEGFDGGLGPFTVQPLAKAGYSTTPSWGVDTARWVSPPGSLYFGDPATHKVSPQRVKAGARALSPVVDLGKTREPALTFQLWKSTEMVPSNDVLSILVILDGAETRVWTTENDAKNSPEWQAITVDLRAFEGKKVTLAIEFDIRDGDVTGASYEGVYIDDFRVAGKCL